MTLGRVHTRFMVGVGAWLLGAGAATGGSLLAVSALGQDLAAAPSQQLTVTAVNRALASEAAEATPSPSPPPPVSSSATPLRSHAKKSPAPPTPTPAPAAAPAPTPTASVFTSAGGTVLASCQSGGAYLASWSPAQGYAEIKVIRGPTATAKVTFTGAHKVVTMAVTCGGGVPSESTSTRPWDE